MHPWTSKETGYRKYNSENCTFGELEVTKWQFDGTLGDIEEFCEVQLEVVPVEIKQSRFGTFDVTTECGQDYRIYTTKEDDA